MKKNAKALIVIAALLLVNCVFIANPAMAAEPSFILNFPVTIWNTAYPTKLVNVETSVSPVSADNVISSNYSGSSTQIWRILSEGNSEYRIEQFYTAGLALNYTPATRCTLYPYRPNYTSDYRVKLIKGSYNTAIYLTAKKRYLGTSGSGNGAQLWWYTNQTKEENWSITAQGFKK